MASVVPTLAKRALTWGARYTPAAAASSVAQTLRASGALTYAVPAGTTTLARSFASYSNKVPVSPAPGLVGEPSGPNVQTEVPGPKSLQLREDITKMQESGALMFFVDFEKSQGNYVVDADGNTLLDAFSHIASMPLGYNHPDVMAAFADPKNHTMLAHRPALGNLPPSDWPERVQRTLMSVAPSGMDAVTLMMCGSCANENALKTAFMAYRARERNGSDPTAEELETCMTNQEPGSPNLSVLSFNGAFHGRLFGVLSCTHTKVVHKLDVPAFDWPMAEFPKLKYPLADFEQENAAEEARCLKQVEEVIIAQQSISPVAVVIVEPIQSEGGDNHASPAFFQGLRDITLKHGVAFMVDEVQTGGGPTGRFWAHEKWGLSTPPDLVSFSKKMQLGGYFTRRDYLPEQGYRIFNTWMGDPSKLVILEAVINTIKRDNLLESTKVTGDFVRAGLLELQGLHSSKISNVRGEGTFLAFDMVDGATRDKFLSMARHNGLLLGGCGTKSVRLRPALVFAPQHGEQLLDIAAKTLSEM